MVSTSLRRNELTMKRIWNARPKPTTLALIVTLLILLWVTDHEVDMLMEAFLLAALVIFLITWSNTLPDNEAVDDPRAESYLIESDKLYISLKQLAEAVARDPSICGPDPVNVYAERALNLIREIDAPQRVQAEIDIETFALRVEHEDLYHALKYLVQAAEAEPLPTAPLMFNAISGRELITLIDNRARERSSKT